MTQRIPVWLLVVFLVATSTASAQRHSYYFHNDRDGWTHLANDKVDWDGSFGSPPGSLRVQASIALSPCLEATPGGFWDIQMDVYSEGSQGCIFNIMWFREPDCSGSVAGSPDLARETRIEGQWVELSTVLDLALIDPYFRIQAHARSRDGFCYLDNVEAIGPVVAPPPIPTLNGYSLVLLAAALAGAGVLLVRRIRP